jgi:hypothetical protein
MLVYGDHSDTVDARLWLEQIREQLAQARRLSGLARHSKLVGALVEAGRLEQGLADAERADGEVKLFTYELARCVVRSWDSDFSQAGELPAVPSIAVAGAVELRVPEGFAFYAVYPQAYAAGARKLRLSGPPRVIGIRSIGTTLGAVVAAALQAPPPLTVRPFGDPFARQVELPAELVERGAHYLIVDEGPGLSGSSFGAVADALEAQGVPPERIAFLPSHGGDLGPRASEAHRARWRTAQRVAAEFEPGFLADAFGPLEPFSSGGPWERLKYLGHSGSSTVLLKFAGLGAIGERKREMARALHMAGLSPEPLGLVHGFLVEQWRGDARRLAPDDKPVREIGHYIGTRAQLFPAEAGDGATIENLLVMCRRNLSLALGEEAARKIERWNAAALSRGLQRARTDNKLDREEWLRLADGHLLKTDAVDHHCGHDLIGCQDMAWDVAGAIVEFALDADGARQLVEATEQASRRRLNPALLEFYSVAYCCFRLGQAKLAVESCGDSGESRRVDSRAAYYEAAVRSLLKHNYCCFMPQKPLVD